MESSYDALTQICVSDTTYVGHIDMRFFERELTIHVIDMLIKFFKTLYLHSINLVLYMLLIFVEIF